MLKEGRSIRQRGDRSMRLKIESKGDFSNVKSWLAGVVNRAPMEALHHVGQVGNRSLGEGTPKNTGETAASWDYQIISSRSGAELYWLNRAHPQVRYNIARMLETGYGTGTGGYVPPRPYIKQAMDRAWRQTDEQLVKELFK